PRDKVCGEGISPGAWPLLRDVGADRGVAALRPRPLFGMRLVAPDGTSLRGHYRSHEPGLAVRRARFDRALLGAARSAGGEVHEGVRVTALRREGDAVRGVVCENGHGPEPVAARLVVGADGRRSVVARQLGLLREARRLRKFAVRGYWRGMEGLGELGEM